MWSEEGGNIFMFVRKSLWEDLRLHLLLQQVLGSEEFVHKGFLHLYLFQAITKENAQILPT